MTGLRNFAELLVNHWVDILVLAAILFMAYTKVKKFIEMSDEERVEAAITIIKQNILKYMSDAELDWADFKKTGAIKKSQVITKIYTDFPILQEVIDQDKLIADIENIIEANMEELNKILKE